MPGPVVERHVHMESRQGEEKGDTEDAAAVRAQDWPVGAAVADGATESAFAGAWAEMLAKGLASVGPITEETFSTTVVECQAAWQEAVVERVAEGPWYLQEKASEGAFAAVVGLSLEANGHWRAVSVGDCCLFHLRRTDVQQVWPLDHPDAFSHRPRLLPSRSERSSPAPQITTGEWERNDVFLLATDAVAAWLLRVGPDTALDLDSSTYGQAVERAREHDTLRNDDATLVVLRVPGDGSSA